MSLENNFYEINMWTSWFAGNVDVLKYFNIWCGKRQVYFKIYSSKRFYFSDIIDIDVSKNTMHINKNRTWRVMMSDKI